MKIFIYAIMFNLLATTITYADVVKSRNGTNVTNRYGEIWKSRYNNEGANNESNPRN